MDTIFRNILNLHDDERHVYYMQSEEVTELDFYYSKIIYQVIFGDKGYIDTLGPVWNLVHDPRFLKAEACFIRKRKAYFGGNTTVGLASISENSLRQNSVGDLEQYATMLGEGRHFCEVLKNRGRNPRELVSSSDEDSWEIIRQECPNFFFKDNTPNEPAKTLFKLFKNDLLGLIEDYASIANVQEWIHLDSNELISSDEMLDPEIPRVWLELDILEKALSLRANIRIVAAKVLRQLGILNLLSNEDRNVRLTDYEADEVLRLIYTMPFGTKCSTENEREEDKLLSFSEAERLNFYSQFLTLLAAIKNRSIEERENEQISLLKATSQAQLEKLRSGEVKPINRGTEEKIDKTKMTKEERQILEIQSDPLKQHLFLLYTQAEALHNTEVVNILKPVFEEGYNLDEDNYWALISKLEAKNGETPLTDWMVKNESN